MDSAQSPPGSKSPAQGVSRGFPSPSINPGSFSYQSISSSTFAPTSGKALGISNTSPQGSKLDNRSPPLGNSKMDAESKHRFQNGQLVSFPTVLMRNLPASLSYEALKSMLLFAEDFIDARFVALDEYDDSGYLSAVAHFRTVEGAYEACDKLHGKLNATGDAAMVVEPVSGGGEPFGERRKTSDGVATRQMSTSASSAGSSNGNGARQSSRFNSTFKSLDKVSPTRAPRNLNLTDYSSADLNAHRQSFVPPHSPIGTTPYGDNLPRSGKSVINEDAVDDETGDLLKDPVAYASRGQSNSRNNQLPVNRLANLSLNVGNNLPDSQQVTSPTSTSGFGQSRPKPPPLQPITSEMSPTAMSNGMPPLSPTAPFPMSPQSFRAQYPPANPADQNPPCNTLYVGNLPVDTSEDELKAMFSKQRGYKRLCFRTKHNGPMCFVEFEDVSFATKALNELYGQPLHNSVKGGIRLSFSKNPLGVRTGQANAMGPQSPLGSPNSTGGFGGGMGLPGFSTANGPPPGLVAPPGLSPPMPVGGMNSGASGSSQNFFSPHSPPLSAAVGSSRAQAAASGFGNSASGGFPDYMLGR